MYIMFRCKYVHEFFTPMSQVEEEIPLEQIEEVSKAIVETVSGLETLEIFREQSNRIHLAFNTEKSDNIPFLVKFLENINQEEDLEEGIRKSVTSYDFIYKNMKYTFNRVSAVTEDYVALILISRDPVNDGKLGLILVVDASGVIFIATCKVDILRKFNLDLMSILYPDS